MTAPERRGGQRDPAEARRAAGAAAAGVYGVSPPMPGGRQDAPVPCPFCGSAETEVFSLFGSSALTSQHYCRACRTVFEQVKWGTPPPDRRRV